MHHVTQFMLSLDFPRNALKIKENHRTSTDKHREHICTSLVGNFQFHQNQIDYFGCCHCG